MSRTSRQPKLQIVPTKFACKAEAAASVFLSGTFNGWNESAMPMTRGKDGIWFASVDVPPGRYEYKFIIDGQWCCSPDLLPDPSYAVCVPNDQGTMNFAADATPTEP